MSVLTGWREIKSLFFIVCLLMVSSVLPGQNRGQADEIQDLISGKIPVFSQNWEIYQDPVSRYIYFANSAGLIEYNGISARTFMMPYRQGIRTVYVNNDGMIFTGSFEDFGTWDKDPSGDLIYKSLASYIDIPKNDEI